MGAVDRRRASGDRASTNNNSVQTIRLDAFLND